MQCIAQCPDTGYVSTIARSCLHIGCSSSSVQPALMVSYIRSCKQCGQARGSVLFQTMPQTVIILAGVT